MFTESSTRERVRQSRSSKKQSIFRGNCSLHLEYGKNIVMIRFSGSGKGCCSCKVLNSGNKIETDGGVQKLAGCGCLLREET